MDKTGVSIAFKAKLQVYLPKYEPTTPKGFKIKPLALDAKGFKIMRLG